MLRFSCQIILENQQIFIKPTYPEPDARVKCRVTIGKEFEYMKDKKV
jgi:hypothetical protein